MELNIVWEAFRQRREVVETKHPLESGDLAEDGREGLRLIAPNHEVLTHKSRAPPACREFPSPAW